MRWRQIPVDDERRQKFENLVTLATLLGGVLPRFWQLRLPRGHDCLGATSPTTGLPRTHYVQPYVRKDGTQVGRYYRSHR